MLTLLSLSKTSSQNELLAFKIPVKYLEFIWNFSFDLKREKYIYLNTVQ